jgi:DNA-binding Lrp family transcriptional regulator
VKWCERGVTLQLSREYLKQLLAVQENPFGTIAELAKSTGTSKPTVAKRLKELGDRRLFVVRPILNDYNLGFEFVDVLIETKNLQGTKRLEEIAEKHPYTSYCGRCYGYFNGILMQFRTPYGTRQMIHELIDQLVEEGVVVGCKFFSVQDSPTVHTPMRIDGWNSETMTWEFDWDKWFKKNPKPVKQKPVYGEPGSALRWFSKKDAYILYEVMRGARRKNLEILAKIKESGLTITPQTFSRRYQMLRDECFSGYWTTFDTGVFDIHNNVIVVGQGDRTYIKTLRERLQTQTIPFQSVMRTSGENLFWYIRLQSSHLSPVLSNLYENLEKMEVSLIDYEHSDGFFVWPGNFDEANKKWIDDRKHMIDEVLK